MIDIDVDVVKTHQFVEEIMEEALPQIDENVPISLISNLLQFYQQF